MRYLFLLICVLSFVLPGCGLKCDCSCENCGKSCVNICEDTRCTPGETCCDGCKCKY